MATESVLSLPFAHACSSPERSLPTSPVATEAPHAGAPPNLNKKKKKKKSKKAKCKDGGPAIPGPQTIPEHRQPVLCISRNKHWKYISSYHVPRLVGHGLNDLLISTLIGTVVTIALGDTRITPFRQFRPN
jgi:hypothetical protein